MQEKKIKVGIVGISFGMEFVPIYQRHPNVESVAVADYNRSLLATCAEKFHIPAEDCYTNLDDMLQDTSIDAIHICTPASVPRRAFNQGFKCRKTLRMYDSYGHEYRRIIRSDRSAKEKRKELYVPGNDRFWKRILLCTGII